MAFQKKEKKRKKKGEKKKKKERKKTRFRSKASTSVNMPCYIKRFVIVNEHKGDNKHFSCALCCLLFGCTVGPANKNLFWVALTLY